MIPYNINFIPSSISSVSSEVENEFKVVVYDTVYNRAEKIIKLRVK